MQWAVDSSVSKDFWMVGCSAKFKSELEKEPLLTKNNDLCDNFY